MRPYKINRDGRVTDRKSGRVLGWVMKVRLPFGPSDDIHMETRWEARPPGDLLTVSYPGTFGMYKTRRDAANSLA